MGLCGCRVTVCVHGSCCGRLRWVPLLPRMQSLPISFANSLARGTCHGGADSCGWGVLGCHFWGVLPLVDVLGDAASLVTRFTRLQSLRAGVAPAARTRAFRTSAVAKAVVGAGSGSVKSSAPQSSYPISTWGQLGISPIAWPVGGTCRLPPLPTPCPPWSPLLRTP